MTHQNLTYLKFILSLTLKIFSFYIFSLSEMILQENQIFHEADET